MTLAEICSMATGTVRHGARPVIPCGSDNSCTASQTRRAELLLRVFLQRQPTVCCCSVVGCEMLIASLQALRYTVSATAVLLLALLGNSAALGREPKQVFAHYMLVNQGEVADDGTKEGQEAKITSYEREIRDAQAIGIDGFALNAGGWLREPRYVRYAAQMFEAAARLNSGFKLMFSADMCCRNELADIEDMMRRFGNNPRYQSVYLKQNGRLVLTTFAGDAKTPAFWQRLRSHLATGTNPSTAAVAAALDTVSGAPSNKPMQIVLVPAFFWGGELPERAVIRQHLSEWDSVIDGFFYWGIAGVPGAGNLDQLRASDSYAQLMHREGKLYIAPVCFQFWGANAGRYYEYSGFSGMRRMWMSAIANGSDWVEIISWNDFVEGTYVSPIGDPGHRPAANDLGGSVVPKGTRRYFHSHAGAYALLPYFIQWFKTGAPPKIERDALYWAYRTHSMSRDAELPVVKSKYGPLADKVYVTANLTAPATLKVAVGTHVAEIDLPAGSTDVEVPFAPSPAPIFEVVRGAKLVLRKAGMDTIDCDPRFTNYYYSTGSMIAATERP